MDPRISLRASAPIASRALGCATVVVLALAFPGSARAQGMEEPVLITYDAPATCPDQAALLHQVSARGPRFRIAASTERARTFAVTITAREGQSTGRLVIRDASGAEGVREMSAASCEAVVSALALVIALAIDSSAGAAAPEPIAAPTAAPAAPTPSPRLPPSPSIPPLPQRAPPVRRESWRAGLGAGLELDGGVTPDLLPAPALFAEAARTSTGLVQPALRLGVRYGTSGPHAVSGGGVVRFRWLAMSLDGCLSRSMIGGLSLTICGRVELGTLHAAAAEIEPAFAATRPWIALAPVARVGWSPSPWWTVELDGGLRFPVLRDRFFFEPNHTVHQPAAIGAILSAGLAVSIP